MPSQLKWCISCKPGAHANQWTSNHLDIINVLVKAASPPIWPKVWATDSTERSMHQDRCCIEMHCIFVILVMFVYLCNSLYSLPGLCMELGDSLNLLRRQDCRNGQICFLLRCLAGLPLTNVVNLLSSFISEPSASLQPCTGLHWYLVESSRLEWEPTCAPIICNTDCLLMTISGFLGLKSHQLRVVVVVTERRTLDHLIFFPKQCGQILETNNLKESRW